MIKFSNNNKFLPEIYNAEKLFEHYLKLMRLDKIKKDSIQYIERKRTFFGAIGITFAFLEELKPEDMSLIEDMLDEIRDFFDGEILKSINDN